MELRFKISIHCWYDHISFKWHNLIHPIYPFDITKGLNCPHSHHKELQRILNNTLRSPPIWNVFSFTSEMWISVTNAMLQIFLLSFTKRWFLTINSGGRNFNQVKLYNYESELCITSDRNPTGISKRGSYKILIIWESKDNRLRHSLTQRSK